MTRRLHLAWTCALLAAVIHAAAARGETPYALTLPRGFPAPNVPADNPLTWEKVELGHLLFYDTRLSGNQTYACASCHQQALAFTDGRPTAIGSTGEAHPRNAMSVVNVAYAGTLTWANNALFTLEDQALGPMLNEHPVELGLAGMEDEVHARLSADPRYRRLFAEAFPTATDPISFDTITQALASFERTIISGDTPYERYVYGVDDNAISPEAKRGEGLFFDEKHECLHCHGGFNFTSSVDHLGTVAERAFHNNALYDLRCGDFGLPDLTLPQCETRPPGVRCDGTGPQPMGCYPPDNTGLYAITQDTADMGQFKAPTLRNIAVTAPYMHDGSIATLSDVLDHYAAGGRTIADGPYAGDGSASPARGQFIVGFALSQTDRAALLAFLESLTDASLLSDKRFGNPFAPVTCIADCNRDGHVSIDEVVTAVGVSLGSTSLALCLLSDPNGDGQVSVDELVHAVHGVFDGCT